MSKSSKALKAAKVAALVAALPESQLDAAESLLGIAPQAVETQPVQGEAANPVNPEVPATAPVAIMEAKKTEGTAVPEVLQTSAATITLQAFNTFDAPEDGIRALMRKAGEKMQSNGALILGQARLCVGAARDRKLVNKDGSPDIERTIKLAVQLFDASMGRAAGDLLASVPVGDSDKHDSVTEFLSPTGTWLQYQANIKGAVKDGIDLLAADASGELKFKSETAVRAARKALQETRNNAGGAQTPEQTAETKAKQEATATSGAAAIATKGNDKGREVVNQILNLCKTADWAHCEQEILGILAHCAKGLTHYQIDADEETEETA